MNPPEVVPALNRLLNVLCRSLSMYLAEARPWTRRHDQHLQEALANVVADRRELSARVARAVQQHHGRPDPGRFPMAFTAINDVALEGLRPKLIEYQQRDVEALRRCVAELAPLPPLHALAEEALGNARGHLEILNQMMNDER